MPATPPLEPPVGTIKPADDEPALTLGPDRTPPLYDLQSHNIPGVDLEFEKNITSNPHVDTLPLDTIKAAIKSRADEAARRVAALRKQRETLNRQVKHDRASLEHQIKNAVTELAEAKRIANSLTPRKPRTKKAPK